MYIRRLPQKQKGRKGVVREGEWEVISSMGQRFLLLRGRNCCAETKESGLLTRYLVPAFRWRGLQMCGRMHIGTESRRQRTISNCAAAVTQPPLAYACMLLFSILYFTTGSLFQQVPLPHSSSVTGWSVSPKLFHCSEVSGRCVSHRLLPLCSLPFLSCQQRCLIYKLVILYYFV